MALNTNPNNVTYSNKGIVYEGQGAKEGVNFDTTFDKAYQWVKDEETGQWGWKLFPSKTTKAGLRIVAEPPYIDKDGDYSQIVNFRTCPQGPDKDEWYKESGLNIMSLNYYDYNPNNYKYGSSQGSAIEKIKSKCNVTFDCNIRCENILPDEDKANMTYRIGRPDLVWANMYSQTYTGNGSFIFLAASENPTYGWIRVDESGYFYPDRNGSKPGIGYSLGKNDCPWYEVYTRKVTTTSDMREKEDIQYLSKDRSGLTEQDCAKFVKDELNLATFKFKDSKKENEKELGFIAQDVLETNLGELIVNKGKTEEDTLTYSLSNYVNVLAGALKVALKEIEELKTKTK